jgi:type II secretory pathway component PulM
MITERVAQIRAQWERLSLRERRLLTFLGGCLIALVVFGVGYVIADGLSSIEVRNREMRQALKDMASHRDEFIRARAESGAWERKIPAEGKGQPLQGFLESSAKDLEITIPEMNERPPQARGKQFVEKSVDIKLRGLNLQQLAEFMRKVEGAPTQVVVVSRLFVRTRFNQHDQLDVEMTVSTFERGSLEKPKGPGKAPRGEKT